jgi:WD40 repeat protein
MVAEVGDERGALPMLAFAAARLWEKRDRADGLLTREAYEQIGGVAGCLAQHAEATLERIGTENTPVLRELFRNLVTARGTRAAQDREELLSVFEEEVRQAAAEVLDSLVDARLLTSYEVPGEPGEGSSRQRVEIIHESLLSNWPRLVRWQAQDEEGALLRDQLRQAAQIWDERGRPEDLLWTGTSYREYELWSARYRGGLSRTEDSFAAAMKSHAERHKRRRRMGIAAVITLLSVGLGVVGMFWRQAAISRDRAETETLRAEANQLLALGRLQINTDSTGALAYALASLERADDPASRLFALEALGRGPAALILERGALGREGAICVDFSPDGKWLVAGYWGDTVKVWPRAGDAPRLIELGGRAARHVRVGPRSELVISRSWPSHDIQISSLLDGRLVRTLPTEGPLDFRLAGGLRPLLTFKGQGSRARVEAWSLEGGGPVVYGELGGDLPEWSKYANPWNVEVDPAGTRLAFTPWRYDQQGSAGSEIFVVGIDETAITSPRLVGRHAAGVGGLAFGPQGKRLASADDVGEVRIWDLESRSHEPQRVLHHPPGLVRYLRFDKTGTKLAATSFAGHTALWSLEGPPDAGPLILRQEHRLIDATFHPSGDWLATASSTGVEVWPLGQRFPRVLSGHGKTVADIAFLPDGNSLASVAQDGTLRLWPLSAAESGGSRVVFDSGREGLDKIVLGPLGRRALVGSATGTVWLVSRDGAEPRQLADFDTRGLALALGEHTVVASGRREGEGARIWDLDTGESRTVDPGAGRIRHFAGFTRDGSLALASVSGIYLWDPEENTAEILSDRPGSVDLTPDGRFLLAASQGDHGEAVLYDLEAGTAVQLDQHGPSRGAWLDAGGKTAVTAPADRGFPRFGLARGGPTHLLASHDRITDATVSLDGRWIALVSAAGSTEIGLWPAPDLAQPPPHTLAHDQLLARLRSLTNLRVVADPDSDTGWGWALNPFPGWEEMPEW